MPLSEADTRAKLIDPALHARGWTEDLIRREETAGAVEIVDGRPQKRSQGRTDYILRIKVTGEAQPVTVALIEAKAENLPPGHGMEQAKLYAECKRLNVPFVIATNGHLFVLYDRITGITTKPRPIAEIPTPAELRAAYEAGMGFSLEWPTAKPLLVKYQGGEATRRYYQDAGIRAVLEHIAKGEKRALLSLATGAGKTFIAVHLLKRIADAGLLRRALFICDRDELRAQGLVAFQNVFGSNAAEVGGGNPQKNARVLIATYQTLGVDETVGAQQDESTTQSSQDSAVPLRDIQNFLTENYPENYFSHIIIDECHRSAWGKWSQVLTRNPNAVQVGLTATPRQLMNQTSEVFAEHHRSEDEGAETSEVSREDLEITADNLKYFGEPVYEYDMAQGMEDGYLAACEVIRRDIFLDKKTESEQVTGVQRAELENKEIRDAITGAPMSISDVPQSKYEAGSFEARLVMPDRVSAMCKDLFNLLVQAGGPEQKTIIFCTRDDHADKVATEMNNLYEEWHVRARRRRAPTDMHYAFKCTAASSGNDQLPDLRGSSQRYFVACTVDLLTTGVDVPVIRNVVFFKYVRSSIAFYQMVGRGTRLHPPSGKLMFRVFDYTDATRLFGKGFLTRASLKSEAKRVPHPETHAIEVEGFEVAVTPAGHSILTMVDGKAMPVTVEEYKERLASRLVEQAPTLEAFRARWVDPPARADLLQALPDGARSALLVRALGAMDAYDLYDVLAELGYGLAPRRRTERAEAFAYKHTAWLKSLPQAASIALQALASQFARAGTDGLENPHIFETPEVQKAGGLASLRAMGRPADILRETKMRIFAA